MAETVFSFDFLGAGSCWQKDDMQGGFPVLVCFDLKPGRKQQGKLDKQPGSTSCASTSNAGDMFSRKGSLVQVRKIGLWFCYRGSCCNLLYFVSTTNISSQAEDFCYLTLYMGVSINQEPNLNIKTMSFYYIRIFKKWTLNFLKHMDTGHNHVCICMYIWRPTL